MELKHKFSEQKNTEARLLIVPYGIETKGKDFC